MLIVLVTMLSTLNLAQADDYILCRREADFTYVNPQETSDEDPCTGNVLIQGIAYQCGAGDEVESKRRQYLEELKAGGRAHCQEFCRKRSTKAIKCRGVFDEPTKCGFTVPNNEAERFGKTKAVCNPECPGRVFAYCSIYHSSMLRTDPALFSGKKPNCECERVK
jgi:hypothetical protein